MILFLVSGELSGVFTGFCRGRGAFERTGVSVAVRGVDIACNGVNVALGDIEAEEVGGDITPPSRFDKELNAT